MTNARFKLMINLLLLFLLASCGSLSKTSNAIAIVKLSAAENINPDNNGRPSPIVVLIYELSALREFDSQDFFDLYDDASSTLSNTMIKTHELEITPNSSLINQIILQENTKHLGIILAFRDINKAQWKYDIKLPTEKESEIFINVGKLSASVET